MALHKEGQHNVADAGFVEIVELHDRAYFKAQLLDVQTVQTESKTDRLQYLVR